jgi:hypothetical protein
MIIEVQEHLHYISAHFSYSKWAPLALTSEPWHY